MARRLADLQGLSEEAASRFLEAWVAEVPLGFEAIERCLRPGLRVLEVGAGTGLLALFLSAHGVDVVALEPVGPAWLEFDALQEAARQISPWPLPRALRMGGEELAAEHGPFDLVFSVNVLEHVPDLDGLMRGMAAVLAPGGRMVHLCPNYAVPYEPHLGIPLLPVRPRATERCFPRRVAAQRALWESVNFITARRLARVARSHGLQAEFRPGLLADALRRLNTDPEFASRHAGPVAVVGKAVLALGAGALLDRVPARLATPMCVELTGP